jgi:2-amino-4-hydroxy-6-hydroxymethyldihydropteridine diphosphokinase
LRSSAELAYLGLGSNLGDRKANLGAALEELGWVDGVEVTACSAIYETEAMGDAAGQRDFYNAAVAVMTTLEPQDLLRRCKAIERRLGREPNPPRHAPRPIDLDVLLFDDRELSESSLVVPHPGITTRRFVLLPLLELDPALTLPGGQPLAEALAALGDGQRAARVGALERAAQE